MRSRETGETGGLPKLTMKSRPVGRVQDEQAAAYRRQGRCESEGEPTTGQRREVLRAAASRQESAADRRRRCMVRLNMLASCGWVDGGVGTKCVVHRVGADSAPRGVTRQSPGVIHIDDVVRGRMTSTLRRRTAIGTKSCHKSSRVDRRRAPQVRFGANGRTHGLGPRPSALQTCCRHSRAAGSPAR
jgi:hypothetical protein